MPIGDFKLNDYDTCSSYAKRKELEARQSAQESSALDGRKHRKKNPSTKIMWNLRVHPKIKNLAIKTAKDHNMNIGIFMETLILDATYKNNKINATEKQHIKKCVRANDYDEIW